ncbi:disease resistance protein RGA2-like [Phragmites australis]|uniref:disease resistance protein RGA2-like n=1 Tax=Phragmites australis TaxID=29695 RepID=UPI002D77146E|nr:disease resistance protein RGA2-like [Phragmites australis]XP_062205926.1 disease resistance protein RGA2-like [Phragmites australis]XP_062205929.1 disease resistance protein RGA2-like [Phragmites australis]
MEAAISAIASEIFSRILSLLSKKYRDHTAMDEKLKRLQQLLLRIHAVVDEADGRYITNPTMLIQLKLLVESMYRGYHMVDIFKYKSLWEKIRHEEGVLQNLEAAIANMTEFVVLLGGCDPCRRPYDTYLYTDNFMFGRHVEKQHIINILLQDRGRHGAPMVLPVIGGCRVGKKTLVSHVCKNDRIQSHFSLILFINGDSIWRIMDHEKFRNGRTLVVIEFFTDVDDDDWVKFYSNVTRLAAEGSKVIIISRIQNLARFGTVKAVFLNSLSREEYSYLFKMLAFGSIDENNHPRLASIANELAVVLGGSLITANVIADLLRRKYDAQFWLRILQRFKVMVDNNLLMYGEHPKDILENERPIDITSFISSYHSALRLMPPRIEKDESSERKLAHIAFGDLITGCIAVPNDRFVLVTWESRIPPYTKLVADVECAEETHECSTSTRKRRSSVRFPQGN